MANKVTNYCNILNMSKIKHGLNIATSISSGYRSLYSLALTTCTMLGLRETECEKSHMPPRFGSTIPYYLLFDRKRDFSVTSGVINDDREQCVICKKYSQGPCGKLFKKWLECVDMNKGKESQCDDLVAPLDKCLKLHEEYYNTIDLYDDSEEKSNINKWKEFILKLEAGDEHPVSFDNFPTEIIPHIQIRLETMMGMIEFYPKVKKSDNEYTLILGYAKDDKGEILAAASASEFYSFAGMPSLRFRATKNTKDIFCCAIYMDVNDEEAGNIIVYRRIESLPKEAS